MGVERRNGMDVNNVELGDQTRKGASYAVAIPKFEMMVGGEAEWIGADYGALALNSDIAEPS
jgi:hypothetical protein